MSMWKLAFLYLNPASLKQTVQRCFSSENGVSAKLALLCQQSCHVWGFKRLITSSWGLLNWFRNLSIKLCLVRKKPLNKPSKMPVVPKNAARQWQNCCFIIVVYRCLKLERTIKMIIMSIIPHPRFILIFRLYRDACTWPRSRGSTKRHFLRPQGWKNRYSTRTGNRLARRLCYLWGSQW